MTDATKPSVSERLRELAEELGQRTQGWSGDIHLEALASEIEEIAESMDIAAERRGKVSRTQVWTWIALLSPRKEPK